ncbi:HD domain-containing protein [Oceanicoccus sp. KOV_DT_Chl]|uniref:HD domain-containing protein n=1 Tax=Oceanicoccus sp. KOV_DT_Chl TaxID=1904639 RepID=UPI000C7B0F69|nr:HD domain-containing protein [Oceanicoccus sp. KOV_DT_Chl]
MNEINQILDFMVEIEKLKAVLRKSRPVGLKRYENSAEHSWHVCLSALMLKDYANEPIDINRVIKMLLIHDLGEIDAGDKIIYSSETVEQKNDEKDGLRRLLDMLPDGMGAEYLSLWEEFEAGMTSDAKFAKAIDRVPPLLHNIHDDGHGWKKHNIPKEKVFALNSERISAGSAQLWEAVEKKLQGAVDSGALV